MSEEEKQKRKKNSVVPYLAVLFAAAFLLLLLAYFMQQRTSEQAIGSLRDSITSIESLDELLEENRTLREENEELTREKNTLASANEALTGQLRETSERMEELELQLTALRILEDLERLAQGDREARAQGAETLEEYESGAQLLGGETLKFWLDLQSNAQDDPSPAQRYEELLEALG